MRAALQIAAILAVIGVAAGCGDDQETTSASTTAPSSVETTTPTDGPTGESGAVGGPGGDQSDGVAVTTPGEDPNDAIEAFFVSGDPDLVCGELATEDLISSAYGDEKGCRLAQSPGASANAIEVREIEVGTHRVEAIVIPKGGPNDGLEHEVVLVEGGDGWQVDSLEVDVPAGP